MDDVIGALRARAIRAVHVAQSCGLWRMTQAIDLCVRRVALTGRAHLRTVRFAGCLTVIPHTNDAITHHEDGSHIETEARRSFGNDVRYLNEHMLSTDPHVHSPEHASGVRRYPMIHLLLNTVLGMSP